MTIGTRGAGPPRRHVILIGLVALHGVGCTATIHSPDPVGDALDLTDAAADLTPGDGSASDAEPLDAAPQDAVGDGTVGLDTFECPPPDDTTAAVYQALYPHCVGCHASGSRGYFASLAAFTASVVADPRLVAPGAPDDSELIRLLEGNGTGAFAQMPIGVVTYADLATSGVATMPMAELRAWVTGLSAPLPSDAPDPHARRITRVSATQMHRSLYQQLGLVHDDFFHPAQEYGVPLAERNSDLLYPIQPPDWVPAPRRQPTADRFYALGGGSAMNQVVESDTVSPTAVLTLLQVSQRWCRLALTKSPNAALFPAGTSMASDPSSVRATITRWSLHFHGQRFTEAEVDAFYDTVFVPLSQVDPEPGFVGLCSAFVRHPRWMVY